MRVIVAGYSQGYLSLRRLSKLFMIKRGTNWTAKKRLKYIQELVVGIYFSYYFSPGFIFVSSRLTCVLCTIPFNYYRLSPPILLSCPREVDVKLLQYLSQFVSQEHGDYFRSQYVALRRTKKHKGSIKWIVR